MPSKNSFAAVSRWAIFAVALAMPISAQAAVYQVAVHYSDLKLTNPEGARALLIRLKSAAQQVCGGRPQKAELRDVATYQDCLHESLDQAVATVDQPQVTALYHEIGH